MRWYSRDFNQTYQSILSMYMRIDWNMHRWDVLSHIIFNCTGDGIMDITSHHWRDLWINPEYSTIDLGTLFAITNCKRPGVNSNIENGPLNQCEWDRILFVLNIANNFINNKSTYQILNILEPFSIAMDEIPAWTQPEVPSFVWLTLSRIVASKRSFS